MSSRNLSKTDFYKEASHNVSQRIEIYVRNIVALTTQ